MKVMEKIQTKLLIDENCTIRVKNYTEWYYGRSDIEKGKIERLMTWNK